MCGGIDKKIDELTRIMIEQNRALEEKTDRILEIVFTTQGEVTILKGQMKDVQNRIGSIEKRLDSWGNRMDVVEGKVDSLEDRMEKRMDKMIDEKLDEKLQYHFANFKKEIGDILLDIGRVSEKHEEEIQKLLCVRLKEKLKKFVSKAN